MVTTENGQTVISKDAPIVETPQSSADNMATKPSQGNLYTPQHEKDMFTSLAKDIQGEQQTYKENELTTNQDFMFAANKMYEKNYNDTFKGNPQELVQRTLQDISYMRDNTIGMAKTIAALPSMTDEEKVGLYYLFKTTDNTDEDNWNAVKRFGKSIAIDPTTYLGLLAPVEFFGKAAAEQVVKKTIMKTLLKHIAPALASGAYTGGFAYGEQKVKEGAGQGFSKADVLGTAAVGAVLPEAAMQGGKAILKGGKAILKKVNKK